MGDRLEPMLAGVLGAFHAALVTSVAVFLLHVTGGLGPVLGGLSTPVGLGLYLALWAAMWLVARHVAGGAAWTATGPADPGSLVPRALLAGGVLGAAIVLLAVFVTAFPFALAQGPGPALGALVFGLIASAFAFVVGALVGGSLAALDLALLRLARRALA